MVEIIADSLAEATENRYEQMYAEGLDVLRRREATERRLAAFFVARDKATAA